MMGIEVKESTPQELLHALADGETVVDIREHGTYYMKLRGSCLFVLSENGWVDTRLNFHQAFIMGPDYKTPYENILIATGQIKES